MMPGLGADMSARTLVTIPGIGPISRESGMIPLNASDDGRFQVGRDGVVSITATADRKVEFVAFTSHTLAHVTSALGCAAYYPVCPVEIRKPVTAVVMDLDGTTVRSEDFWIRMIQMSVASLLGDPGFKLEKTDLPFVSGHSVSEHLHYCIDKYCRGRTLAEARHHYFEHTHREMRNVLEGHNKPDAFRPSPGLKDFLLELKAGGVRVALVTSGLYEKAWPEITSAFRAMDMGDPKDFYDAIVTAGFAIRKGEVGTLGELSPKPHPWLYLEACRVGLGIPFADSASVIGIEDSGAGVCSIRLAGLPAIGITGGNIIESGTKALCHHYCTTFEDVLAIMK